ncbi:ABC transporter permease [Pseudactinotalea sp. Z1748]|uniref:ABC transporter permease n=1 Tax=Pseudactinotalea sp. Z1748 TaxID=3413027 RepID=UPI003C7C2FD5
MSRGTGVPYFAARIGQAATVLLVAFTAAFLLLQAMPGDALMIRFENPELGLSPAQIADLRTAYGADTPLHLQFWHSLSGVFRGDLGYSIESGTAVSAILADVVPRTLMLAGLGFVVAASLAFSIAFAAGLSRFAWLRSLLRAAPSLFVSVPVFWLGILLIQIFSFRLGWVPIINPGPVVGLVLPVLTLAVPISAPLAQILIRSMDAVSLQPFVTVTRAKGATELWTQWHAVLRNAVLPTMTMAGVLFGELIAGAVVTETVFARSGLGRITEQAVRNQDIPVLQGVVLLAAAVFVVINLGVDLLYPRVDPRLRGKVAAAR